MKARVLLIALACTALLAAPASSQGMSGTVAIGGRGASDTGNLGRAAEYRTTENGAELAVDLTALYDQIYLAVFAETARSNDQRTSLDFELARTVRSHTTFTALPHNLEHDSLANLRGAVGEVKVTWSTDLDPAARYAIDYSVLENRTEFQFPDAGWLTVAVDYREQWREGHRQSLSISHCSTCHVQSRGRAVNEHTRDGGVSARATFGAWSVTGGYSERDYRERGATPTRLYELAEHPAQRKPLFNDRIQYDSRDGALPYDFVPTTEKRTVKGSVANPDLGGFALSFGGVSTKVRNTSSGNEVEYDGFNLALARRVGKQGTFSLRARTYSIDSSDFWVDATEPVAVAGLYPGKTYRERYGLDPDYLRQSAIDREVTEAQARFAYRLAKRSSLAATYDIRNIDRDSYAVAVGETGTLEQKLKLVYSLRPGKGLQLRAAATWADISHPFALLDGACITTALQTAPAASPMAPGSVQYYQLHEARVADLSASPSQYAELKVTGSYQLSPSSLASVSYQWWDGKNDGGDLNDWSKTLAAVIATVVLAPSEAVEVHAGASYRKRELEQHICIPLMDG